MSGNSPHEDLNLSLDLGKQAPEIDFRVDQGEKGTELLVAEGTLNGFRYSDKLFAEVITQIKKTLPEGLLSDEVKVRLAEQFRERFEQLKLATYDLD